MESSMTPNLQRFESLDLIRGIAVLGILMMNIASFSHPLSYYVNPISVGEVSNLDITIWYITHFLADQKFYTLFCMLFGAGIMLMAQRASSKGVSPTPVHMKRMAWLLIFGLLHGFFIWYGDILAIYALMGFWVYFLALNTTAKIKFYIAISLMLIFPISMAIISFFFDLIPASEMEGFYDMFQPSEEVLAEEITAYKGGWVDSFLYRTEIYFLNFSGMIFLAPMLFAGAMIFGMGLYQKGILTAEKSKLFYIKFSSIMLAIGAGMMYWDYLLISEEPFGFHGLWLSYWTVNTIGAAFIALGYIGLLCLWAKSNGLLWLRRKFEAVGKMAFTNYIMQSVVMTTIFYGFGFGLFAELERYELYYFVFAVYLIQLIGSELWLKKFYFGPLEWLWRSLTYGKAQPFSRAHS